MPHLKLLPSGRRLAIIQASSQTSSISRFKDATADHVNPQEEEKSHRCFRYWGSIRSGISRVRFEPDKECSSRQALTQPTIHAHFHSHINVRTSCTKLCARTRLRYTKLIVNTPYHCGRNRNINIGATGLLADGTASHASST